MTYKTKGTCSASIDFDVVDGKVHNVRFVRLQRNLQGIGILTENMPIDEVITKLEGVDCHGKGTSCPDQLAKALKEYKKKNNL